jgi:hypothetical protein
MADAEYDALCSRVRGIVESAIASLVDVGLSNQGALSLLMTQAAIRMHNAADVREVLKSIGDGLVDYDGTLN